MDMLIRLFLALIIFSFISCSPKKAISPPQLETGKDQSGGEVKLTSEETLEKKWQRTLREAKKEGKVVVAGTGSAPALQDSIPLFKQRYGIVVEVIVGRAAEVSSKLRIERANGLFMLDIMIPGLNTAYMSLKPSGALDPMEPALILPEVTDLSVWYEGQIPWGDKEKSVFKYSAYPSTPLAINTEFVAPSEIKSYFDLLEPKWKGKIVMDDPIIAGPAFNGFSTLLFNKVLDLDFFRQLVKQEPVAVRDQRLQVDWLAKGKYTVALWQNTINAAKYIEAGAPIALVSPKEGTYLSAGGALALINRAPHPNAAKIFINWALSKEGQISLQKFTGRQSARIDIGSDGVDPTSIRTPGQKYFQGANDIEAWVLHEQDRYLDLARNIFGPVIGR